MAFERVILPPLNSHQFITTSPTLPPLSACYQRLSDDESDSASVSDGVVEYSPDETQCLLPKLPQISGAVAYTREQWVKFGVESNVLPSIHAVVTSIVPSDRPLMKNAAIETDPLWRKHTFCQTADKCVEKREMASMCDSFCYSKPTQTGSLPQYEFEGSMVSTRELLQGLIEEHQKLSSMPGFQGYEQMNEIKVTANIQMNDCDDEKTLVDGEDEYDLCE